MGNITEEELMDIEKLYDRMFSEARQEYEASAMNVSLGSLVGGEKGAAYADWFPITEDLSNLMKIQDMEVKKIALMARYKNYPPRLNAENKFEFVSLCAKPNEFLVQHKDFLSNYSFISNYIDEAIAWDQIEHDYYDGDKQIFVDGLLPQCFEMVGAKNDPKMQKAYLEYLAKYSAMPAEYAKAAKKLFGGPEGPSGPANA